MKHLILILLAAVAAFGQDFQLVQHKEVPESGFTCGTGRVLESSIEWVCKQSVSRQQAIMLAMANFERPFLEGFISLTEDAQRLGFHPYSVFPYSATYPPLAPSRYRVAHMYLASEDNSYDLFMKIHGNEIGFDVVVTIEKCCTSIDETGAVLESLGPVQWGNLANPPVNFEKLTIRGMNRSRIETLRNEVSPPQQ